MQWAAHGVTGQPAAKRSTGFSLTRPRAVAGSFLGEGCRTERVVMGSALHSVEAAANFPDALPAFPGRQPVGGVLFGVEAIRKDMYRSACRRDQELVGPVSGRAKIWLECHGEHLCVAADTAGKPFRLRKQSPIQFVPTINFRLGFWDKMLWR